MHTTGLKVHVSSFALCGAAAMAGASTQTISSSVITIELTGACVFVCYHHRLVGQSSTHPPNTIHTYIGRHARLTSPFTHPVYRPIHRLTIEQWTTFAGVYTHQLPIFLSVLAAYTVSRGLSQSIYDALAPVRAC